jgi:hypothetical protein
MDMAQVRQGERAMDGPVYMRTGNRHADADDDMATLCLAASDDRRLRSRPATNNHLRDLAPDRRIELGGQAVSTHPYDMSNRQLDADQDARSRGEALREESAAARGVAQACREAAAVVREAAAAARAATPAPMHCPSHEDIKTDIKDIRAEVGGVKQSMDKMNGAIHLLAFEIPIAAGLAALIVNIWPHKETRHNITLQTNPPAQVSQVTP